MTCDLREGEGCGYIGMMEKAVEQAGWCAGGWTRDMLDTRGYPAEISYLVAALEDIQAAFGYVPEDALPVLAGHFGSDAEHIRNKAEAFGLFRFVPPPAHRIGICHGPVCAACGGKELLADVSGSEGIGVEPNHCLGRCDQAPVVSIDGRLLTQATAEQIEQEIAVLRGENQRR